MANDEDLVKQLREHQECWELLPWAVNGRLSSSDTTRVSQHLQHCARCSEELHAQHQLCEAIRADDPVLLAPQASLKKLWQRFEAPQPQAEPALVSEYIPPAAVAPSPAATPPPRSRRLYAALVAQAAVIVVLLSWATWQTQQTRQTEQQLQLTQQQLREAPRYITMSQQPRSAVAGQSTIRVVFDKSTSVQDMAELLHSVDAHVLDGPSTNGVFTLSLANGSPQSAARAAELLQADARVEFAQPSPVPEAP